MNEQTETRPIAIDTVTDSAPAGSLLSLQRRFGSGEGGEETFMAILPGGVKIPCRKITDAKAMANLRRAANKFGQDMAAKTEGELTEAWRPYHVTGPDGEEIYTKVFILSRQCDEPDFKGNQLNCLILARTVGPVFEGILQQISLASVNLLQAEVEVAEVSKATLPATA